jgi:hypothetical protein
MAMAVQRLFKDAQVTIGPWIERGFYYDFDLKEPLSDKDLKRIHKEMAKIIKMDLPFIREEVRGAPAGWGAARARRAGAAREGGCRRGRQPVAAPPSPAGRQPCVLLIPN